MTKSKILSDKLHRAEYYLELAKKLVNQVIDSDENGDGISAGLFNNSIERTLELIDDLGYEIIMPLEMEEIDCSVCVAKEGDEDSFSNLGV
jgi:hypothetical protein